MNLSIEQQKDLNKLRAMVNTVSFELRKAEPNHNKIQDLLLDEIPYKSEGLKKLLYGSICGSSTPNVNKNFLVKS